MDAVKAFNTELSSLYEVKPPISKAKMNSLTRGAIKGIKFYKHVVQSVEKFIQKCKPEYKVPGLYVIDSIVRQSRHQFGTEKDVFAPRFAKNMQTTFLNLLKCPPEDKSKLIRVLNLWQKNAVFPPEVIQPLFDLVDPNHPIHKEQSNGVLNASAGNNVNNVSTVSKSSPSTAKNTPKDQKLFSAAKPIDPAWLAQTKMETANIVNANKLLGQVGTNQMDVSFLDQLQHLQQLLLKKQEAANEASQSSVKFDKKLLDFDYGEEEDDDVQQVSGTSPKISQAVMNQHTAALTTATSNLESLGLLLANPEVLRQLQTLQQTMQQNSTNAMQHEMEEKMRKLQQMKQQEEEFDKHLAQTVPSLPFAAECELKPTDIMKPAPPPPPPPPPPPVVPYAPVMMNPMVLQPDMSQPPPGYHPPAMPFVTQPPPMLRPPFMPPVMVPQQSPQVEENNVPRRENSVEIVNCEPSRSQSRSPDRYSRRHSRSRSPRHRGRDRSRDRKSRSRSRSRSSRSRSRSRSRRRRSRDRNDRKRDDSRDRMTEEEREKERERRKRGLPPLIKEKLSVCSTTLWVGHLSKLVHQEELSDTFGEFGDIVSIDLISPRGCAFICMNRRQDAYRALTKLKNHKMQGKAITLAWAPGKGVKGKEWKDYWEVELGVSYIPWNKLNNITDHELDLLEEGGMIDEDSMPARLKGRRKRTPDSESTQSTSNQGSAIPTVTDGIVQQPPTTNTAPMVDTSQPPPIRPPGPQAPLLPPPNQLQMMPPGFSMPPGMLGPMGLSMPPGLMPNVPIGVPPPNMQGLIGPPGMMQPMMQPPVNTPFGAGVGVGLLTQIPMPAPAAPSDKPNSTGMPHNVPPLGVPPPTSESGMPSLPMMRQPYGVPPMPMQQMPPQPPSQQQQRQPQPPLPHQQHSSDDMDVEMEDAMTMPPSHVPNKDGGMNNKGSLTDQLLASMKNDRSDGDRDSFRDRERDRDRRGERDRDRDGGGGLGDRDRNDRRDDRSDSRGRDRGRGGRDRTGRDRRRSRERDRDDRRNDRDRDRDLRHSPMRQQVDMMGPNSDPLGSKKDVGPKPSLADRLRQLADGTLPLVDERLDRDSRGRNDRGSSNDRHDRGSSYDEPSSRRQPLDGPPLQQPPSLLGAGRRPGDGPPSLLDLPPQKFPGGPDRPDFGPRDFGPRSEGRDLRDFPQRIGDRDNRPFGLRPGDPLGRGGPLDDFSEPPHGLMDRRFGPPDEFDRLSGRSRIDPMDFDMRLGPGSSGPPSVGPRDADFDVVPGSGASGRSDGRSGPAGRHDDFDRQGRFDFDMRQRKPGDGPPGVPFDMPRGMPDEFDMRDHPDFDPEFGPEFGPDFGPEFTRGGRRGDFYMDSRFGPGPPGMMGPRGPRGPVPPGMMGPEGFGSRGRVGPPMFHRGMGPRGMRPGMRPAFGPNGPPGGPGGPVGPGGPGGPRSGPPFDPRDGPDGPFFRQPGFDEGRGNGGPPMGRPGMPPFGIGTAGPGGHPPPLLGNLPDGPWRNEAGPMLPMLPREPGSRLEEGEESKEKKRGTSTDRETRRRENRKSRWGNASPTSEPVEGQSQKEGSVPSSAEGGGLIDSFNNPPEPREPMNAPPQETWEDSEPIQEVNMELADNTQPEPQSGFDARGGQDDFYAEVSQRQPQAEDNHPPPPENFEHYEPPQEHREEHFESSQHNRFKPSPPPERYDQPPLPLEQFEPPQEHFEPPPEHFEPPPERFEVPQERFEAPQEHFEPPQEQFEPPQERFEAPQEHFEPPPERFEPPPQERFEPPQECFEPPQERFEPPPERFEAPPQERFEAPPQEHYEPPQEHYEPPQERFEPPQQERYEPPAQESFEPPQEHYQQHSEPPMEEPQHFAEPQPEPPIQQQQDFGSEAPAEQPPPPEPQQQDEAAADS